MPNPLDKFGPPLPRKQLCPACQANPCRCMVAGTQNVNPLAVPLCTRCHQKPCCCKQTLLCPRCSRTPCGCDRGPPWNQPPPYDEYATCPCGYQVGDVLTAVGGTGTPATLTVTTTNPATGSVTGVTVNPPGGTYSVEPPSPFSTTGGHGQGATFNILTYAGGNIGSVSVQAGGTSWPPGYRVGDVCQLEGGVFTAPASVVVTGTTSGQVSGVAVRTPGNYSALPCSPAPTIGGHGCGLKITGTFVAGAMTVAVIADIGGPCYQPVLQWWQRTPVNVFPAGSGPPAQPRNSAIGRLICGWSEKQQVLLDQCTPPTVRPLTYLWLPLGTDCNAMCCSTPGDVVEVPAKSGRLYDVFYTEYVDIDTPGCSAGPPGAPWPPQVGEYVGGYLLVILQQQCPFGAVTTPSGTWLTADDGVTVLLADPWHWLAPQ